MDTQLYDVFFFLLSSHTPKKQKQKTHTASKTLSSPPRLFLRASMANTQASRESRRLRGSTDDDGDEHNKAPRPLRRPGGEDNEGNRLDGPKRGLKGTDGRVRDPSPPIHYSNTLENTQA